jgi:hypothetical protein
LANVYTLNKLKRSFENFNIDIIRNNQESEYYLETKSPCIKSCNNPHYNISYAEDKHFGSDYYQVNPAEECIQAEIMSNGPVEAVFDLHEDFSYYKDGSVMNMF